MNRSKLTKEEEEEEEGAMELELGLKLTRTRDVDLTSLTDVRITKNPSAPLFVSKETDCKFILTGHLRGYRKENIDIEINEFGNRIAMSGRKPVQEMLLMGLFMQRSEMEIRGFRKVFRIPEGVNLDKIKAKFNEETSDLTILMPKKFKGFSGVVIEEVKEDEVDGGRPERTESVVNKKEPEVKPVTAEGNEDTGQVMEPATDRKGRFETAEEILEEDKADEAEANVDGGESKRAEVVRIDDETPARTENEEDKAGVTKIAEQTEEEKAPEPGTEKPENGSSSTTDEEANTTSKDDQLEGGLQKQEASASQSQEVEGLPKLDEVPRQVPGPGENQANETDSSQYSMERHGVAANKKGGSKKNKACPPLVVAGSALFVSLIVLVFQLIRSKKRKSN